MSKFQPLPFHVFDNLNTLRARFHFADDAARFVGLLGKGAHVVTYDRGETRTLWVEGSDADALAGEAAVAIDERRSMKRDAFARDVLKRRGEAHTAAGTKPGVGRRKRGSI